MTCDNLISDCNNNANDNTISNLLFDPQEESLLVFNPSIGVTLCKVCEIGLEINYTKENDVIKLSCGVYHLRHYHKMDQDRASKEIDWLVKYLLLTYIDSITIEQQFTKWREIQSYYYIKSTLFPPAIEGIKIEEGIECQLCKNDSNKAQSFFTNTLFKNKNMRRHIKDFHPDQTIHVITNFPLVSIQQMYQRNVSSYFGVTREKNSAKEQSLSILNILFPKLPNSTALTIEAQEIVLFTSGLEGKLKWTEKCLPLSKEIVLLFNQKDTFADEIRIIDTLVEQYLQWINECLDSFGINGVIEITISKLSETSRSSYQTEWCRFLYFLFKVSNDRVTFKFVEGFDRNLIKEIKELYALLVNVKMPVTIKVVSKI